MIDLEDREDRFHARRIPLRAVPGNGYGQGTVRLASTVEPSSKLNCEATGQPPRGQCYGSTMPFTWSSRFLPWTVL